MLPTSRPANYSNSQDFRLAGGRRQILTKNIKPSSVLARLSDGRRSVSSISLREPEDRHHVAHLSILIQKREPRPIRVPSGDGVEIRVRNSKPERLVSRPVRLPISLLSRDSRHVWHNAARTRCGLARIGCGATATAYAHCTRSRETKHRVGARGNVVVCGSIALQWTCYIGYGRPPSRCHGRFAFGRRGLIDRPTLFS